MLRLPNYAGRVVDSSLKEVVLLLALKLLVVYPLLQSKTRSLESIVLENIWPVSVSGKGGDASAPVSPVKLMS